MRSKKGNLAFVLLPVMTLVLCTFALFVLYSYSGDVSKNSKSINEAVTELAFMQSYILSVSETIANESIILLKEQSDRNPKEIYQEIAQRHENIAVIRNTNFFAKIRNGEFNFEDSNGVYSLNFEDIFVISKREEISLQRSFFIDKSIYS